MPTKLVGDPRNQIRDCWIFDADRKMQRRLVQWSRCVPQSSRNIEDVAGADDAFPAMFRRRLAGLPREGRIQPPTFLSRDLSYEDIMFISMDIEAMDISPC